MPKSVIELFACWRMSGRLRSTGNWKIIPICLFWCLRKEKIMCFEDLEKSLEDILAAFLHTLYLWTMAFMSPLLFSLVEFLVRLSLSS